MKTLLMAAAAAMTLVGCANSTGFDREAGASIDNGNFGNATMNNSLAQTGQSDFTINLARRFAAEIPTTVTFPFNSAALDSQAQATLRQQAGWIRQFPEVRFKVFGHTDLVGSSAYNRRLGLTRAQTAVSYLVAQGVDRSRLEAVVSFGETQPLIATSQQERQNRRTVTEVSGFVGNHPTVLNGKYAEIIFRDYVNSASQTTTSSDVTGITAAGGGG